MLGRWLPRMLRYWVTLLWLVAFVVGIRVSPSVVTFLRRVRPEDDWSQFLPDTLSAVVAIAFGIPVGLALNRLAESRKRKEGETARVERLRQTLRGLQAELRFNQTHLKSIVDYKGSPEKNVPEFDLRAEVWEALSASGGLSVITDAAFLSQLAVAYYAVRGVNVWRRHLRDNWASPEFSSHVTVRHADETSYGSTKGVEGAKRIWPPLHTAANEAYRICGVARLLVDKALEALPPVPPGAGTTPEINPAE